MKYDSRGDVGSEGALVRDGEVEWGVGGESMGGRVEYEWREEPLRADGGAEGVAE